jgi:hypothetical protein
VTKFDQNRSGCNFEIRSQPTGAPVTASGYTPVEEKILRLALDPAAFPGEVDSCGIRLIRSLRRRGVTADQLLQPTAQPSWAARELDAARGYCINFGRFRGRSVGEIPGWYLEWALKNCRNMTPNLRRAMQIVLDQGSRK